MIDGIRLIVVSNYCCVLISLFLQSQRNSCCGICFHRLCIKVLGLEWCCTQLFPFSLDLIDHKPPVGCGSEFQRHEYLLGSERLVKYEPMGEEDPGVMDSVPVGKTEAMQSQ